MLLDEVTSYLQSQGYGTVGTDIFAAFSPDVPDVAIIVHEYPGRPSEQVLGPPGINLEYPRIQIVVRGVYPAGYQTARRTSEQIYQMLGKLSNLALSGVRYLSTQPLQSPFPLRRDEKGRIEIVCNYQVCKEPSGL